jgi:NO-binding membrane sensor protein with MHYT domain
MPDINQFTYGWLTPALAYLLSVVGSLLALRCMTRARTSPKPRGWIVTAAIALGGTGIWVMHFIAMLGFSVHDATIRYNVPITLLSALLAIVVVWVGLRVVVRNQGGAYSLLIGGTITGLGVGAMHYAGMYAMKTNVAMEYDLWIVLLSIAIAIASATAALWFALHIHGMLASIGAALIMGVAVCGMHYTGMYAMYTHSTSTMSMPSGAQAQQLLTPLIIGVSMVTILMFLQVGITDPEEPDLRPLPGRHASRYWPSQQ